MIKIEEPKIPLPDLVILLILLIIGVFFAIAPNIHNPESQLEQNNKEEYVKMTEEKEQQLLKIIKAQSDCIHNMWQEVQKLNAELDMLMTEDVSKALIKLNEIPEPTETLSLDSFIKQFEKAEKVSVKG